MHAGGVVAHQERRCRGVSRVMTLVSAQFSQMTRICQVLLVPVPSSEVPQTSERDERETPPFHAVAYFTQVKQKMHTLDRPLKNERMNE